MSTITIGVDLAKSVFSVCEVDGAGHVLRRQDLRRDAFGIWLAGATRSVSGWRRWRPARWWRWRRVAARITGHGSV